VRARLESLPGGQRPSPCFAEGLVDQFTRYWQPDRIGSLAVSREFPRGLYDPSSTAPAAAKLTVAIAYDEAFNRYFQDTLDLLELRGASIVDFSPLRDESLPPDTDLVYLGCGHPERYAAALSENHCMKAALRSHLAAGHRLYAEGGGAAYLCQQMETPKGEWKRMVGIFPAAASLKRAPQRSAPVEVTLNRPNWLGAANARLRGYRNPRWEVRPLGRLTCFASDDPNHCDLMGSFRAIGSLLHLDFAAQPASLDRFFYPGDPQPVLGDPWAAVLEAGD
jgi:cobyrinic acid a,c-diamide synthase